MTGSAAWLENLPSSMFLATPAVTGAIPRATAALAAAPTTAMVGIAAATPQFGNFGVTEMAPTAALAVSAASPAGAFLTFPLLGLVGVQVMSAWLKIPRAREVSMNEGKGWGGGEATRDPEPTYIDPNDPKAKQQAIHTAQSFADYLASRSGPTPDYGGSGAPAAAAPAPASPPPADNTPAEDERTLFKKQHWEQRQQRAADRKAARAKAIEQKMADAAAKLGGAAPAARASPPPADATPEEAERTLFKKQHWEQRQQRAADRKAARAKAIEQKMAAAAAKLGGPAP